MAKETPNSVFTDQCENVANTFSHAKSTGPEIWEQSDNEVDVFLTVSGSGGTIAGCSQFLKKVKPKIKVVLVDAPGSGLFDYIKTGRTYGIENFHGRTETMIKPGKVKTIVVGIGGNDRRITRNFQKAQIDSAVRVNDEEAVEMMYYLKQYEDMSVGPTGAMNLAGAVKMARVLGEGHTIVTILCDHGDNYKTKHQNQEWLQKNGLVPHKYRKGVDNLDFVQPVDNDTYCQHFSIS